MVGLDWGIVRFYTLSDGEYQERASRSRSACRSGEVAAPYGSEEKVFKQLEESESQYRQVAPSHCQHQKDFLHQSSNDISKNHAVVFVEDLQVKNMSKSSKGTKDQPGSRWPEVWAHRAILDGSPFELRRQLEYTDRVEGRSLVSRATAEHQPHLPGILGGCGLVSADNRKTQAKFACVQCGLSANADFISAVNIREAGFASLACSQPSHAVSASWQEPTEGIHA